MEANGAEVDGTHDGDATREGPPPGHTATLRRAASGGDARAAGVAIKEGDFRADLDPELFSYELYGILAKFHLESRLLRNRKASSLARRAFKRLLEDARG